MLNNILVVVMFQKLIDDLITVSARLHEYCSLFEYFLYLDGEYYSLVLSGECSLVLVQLLLCCTLGNVHQLCDKA